MAKLNKNFLKIKQSYLFAGIAQKVREYSDAHPDADIIRLGIGDVTLPLVPAVIEALHKATDEMSRKEDFRGYGPEQGYPFLRSAVAGYYRKSMGVEIADDEIFISDGAKSDIGNIVDLFDVDNTVVITDPVYPVYPDTNVMSGREITYLAASSEEGFLPMPDHSVNADMIYLCNPNNPTGAAYTREQLAQWVDYAKKTGAVLLMDSAYERYVSDPALPRSIFEIPGAKECAIEFCSLSKTAGFTGLRCGYTVVPHDLKVEGTALNPLWKRRQTTKFNGVPYIVQRAAEAVFSEEGSKQIDELIAYYRRNAQVITSGLKELGIPFFGGINSPYIWMQCPNGMKSWEFFDYLLNEAEIVGTPGEGFGQAGEGFFRLTSFGDYDNTVKAVARIRALLSK